MSNKTGWLFVLPLLFLACQDPFGDRPNPPADQAELTDYQLTVVLRGLVALVPKATDQVWALLVDAEYDPTLERVETRELPPCADLDICGGACDIVDTGDAMDRYPPHYAFLRIRGAKVGGVPKELLLPMAGTDLRINPGRAGGTADLSLLSSSSKIQTARCDPAACDAGQCDPGAGCKPEPDPEELDQVGSAFVDPDSATALAERDLSGRVLLEAAAGDQLVAEKTCASLRHSFASRTDIDCVDAEPLLADETKLIQQLRGPTKLVFAESGAELLLEPINAADGIEIIIGNQVAEAILHPDSKLCKGEGHPKGFRWLYRFSATVGEADCSDHYYPCVATAAGRKCPQKQLQP